MAGSNSWTDLGLSCRDALGHQYETGRSKSRPRESCDSDDFRYLFPVPERIQKPIEPAPWGPKKGDGDGPRSPDISRPDTKDLLKKMRKVDPNQSKRYRQRTGQ